MMVYHLNPHNTALSDDPNQGAGSHLPHDNVDICPVAQLHTIDAGRLHAGDTTEAAKLFEAAKEDGLFYLNLRDRRFMGTIDTVDEVFALSKELFSLTAEEKMGYDIDELGHLKLNGYKPVGRNFGGLNGNRDGFESYTIPGKVHLDFSFASPSILTHRFPCLATFSTQTQQILALLLSSLSTSLNLPPNASLTELHRSSARSPDILRLLHYLPQPLSETGAPQAAHTDLGSLTLLFSNLPGLQVLLPGRKEWAFVLPRLYCAIVNVGDGTYPGLAMLTGGLFHSCLHRVSPLPGGAMKERYSVAYLQRADDDVKLEALPGIGNGAVDGRDVYTSQEWLEKKFGMLRRKTWKEGAEGQRILTGRKDVDSTRMDHDIRNA